MILIAIIRDWHQTMSWRLGFGHGKRWRAYRCPWWADEAIYRLGHNYSRGVEIPPFILRRGWAPSDYQAVLLRTAR
jgi:hypothetical protein